MKPLARRQPGAPPGVDPALVPFLDALAALLAAQERRFAEGRRALQATAQRNPGKARAK